MKIFALSVLLVGSIAVTAVLAAPPAGAPAGTGGLCNDGTYSSSAEKKGACRGHKGVKDWYGEGATPANGPATSERAPAPPPSSTTSTSATKPTAPAMAGRTSGAPTTPMGEAAAGGGAGKVWANTSTKVYHCTGDKYYGTTKHGEYMSEGDAKTKGFHADHGKACS